MKNLKICVIVCLMFCLKGFGQISAINESPTKEESSFTSIELDELKKDFLISYINEMKHNDFVESKDNFLSDFKSLKESNYSEIMLSFKNEIYRLKDSVISISNKKNKTKDSIKIKNYNIKINNLNLKIDKIQAEISNSETLETNLNHYLVLNKKKKEYNKELKALKAELSKNTDLNTSIILNKKIVKVKEKKELYERNYINYKSGIIKPESFMPSKNIFFRSYFFETYYGKKTNSTSYLNSLAFVNSSSSSVISSELVADNLGWSRVSFGTSLSIDDDSIEGDKEEIVEKLINQGGNFYLDFTLPIYATYDYDYFTFYGFVNAKSAVDIKGFDSDIQNTGFNASIGGKIYMSLSTVKKEFVFSILMDSNLIYGSKELFENFEIKNQVLFNTNLTGYITISNKYRIALRTNFASHPNLRTERFAFGLQLLK